MRLVHIHETGGDYHAAAIVARDGADMVVPLQRADPTLPRTIDGLLQLGDAGMAAAADAVGRYRGEAAPLTDVKLIPPVVRPQKILCVGLNYADHAAETGAAVGDEPVIFNKLPSTLRGPSDPIELPPESSEVDYEAELVVVIGKPCRRVSRADAFAYVAGYACGNDVSARDWQKGKPGKQWLLGKSFDSFAPLGPWLATRDEVATPGELPIQLRLNGKVMQDSYTRQLIFPIDYLVSYLSHVCTLLPGDLIYTGTPPGVGMARNPPVFLKHGDVVEVEIAGLGVLRNPVVAAL